MADRSRASAYEVAVRMHTTVADAEVIGDVLLRGPHDVRARLHDQLWLKTILTEQRRRTRIAERDAFDARADRILELLDPPEQP